MMQALPFQIGRAGFLRGVKGSDVHPFAIDLDLGHEPVMVLGNANQSGSVRPSRAHAVLQIDQMRNIAQVGKPVVRWVAVDMVNVAGRPNTVNVEPSQSMRADVLAVNADKYSAVWLNTSGNRSGKLSASIGAAGENAGISVVVQKGAESIRCQFEH